MVPYYPPPDISKSDIKAVVGVFLVCCALISLFIVPLHYLLITASACVYFWPTIIAVWKGHNLSIGIFVFNALLGWTGILWIFALWMATDNDFYSPRIRDSSRPSGLGSTVIWPEYINNSGPILPRSTQPVQPVPAKPWIYKSSSRLAWEKLEAMVDQAKKE